MELLIMQFSSHFYQAYFLFLTPKYSPQHSVFKHPQFTFIP